MRLHRLTLRHVRGVEERSVSLAPDEATGTGVVIVEGLNEAGKSTLGDALDVLLTYKDSSRHGDVRSLQSAGRDEPPEIEAELEIGAHRLTYAKRYLKRTGTRLTISSPHGAQLDGDPAHDRVVGLLADHLDVGLWSSLRLRQAEGLAQAAPGNARGLAAALSASTDVSAIGDRELTILHAVQEEYERYFTAKAGAKKPLLRDAEATVSQLTVELATIDDKRALLERDVDRADRLSRSLPERRTQVAEADERAAAHAARRAEVSELARTLERRREVEEQAIRAHDRVLEQRARRVALIDELAEVERTEQDHRAALADAEAGQHRASERLTAARAVLEAAQEHQRSARRGRECAQQDLDHLHEQDRRSALASRAERAAAALTRRREAEATCATLTIDEALLDELRRAHRELTRSEASLEAASPQLGFTAAQAVRLVADGASLELAEGDRASWSIQDVLTLRIGEVGEVEVRAGAGIEAAADAHRVASEQLRAGLERARVADLSAAEEAVRRRTDAERTIAEAERERATALDGWHAEELDEELDRLARAGQRALADRDAATALPATVSAARTALDAAITAERAADAAVADPGAEVEAARLASTRGRERVVELTTRSNDAADRRRAIAAELADARSAVDDQHLDTEVAAAGTARAAAHAEVTAAAAELAAADPDAVTELADNAAAVAEDARARLRATEQDLRDTRVRIGALGGDGLWEQREATATALAHATLEHQGLWRRATAARTLRDTLERHRSEARDRYAAPLREQLLAYGRMLYGPAFDLELDEDLRVARRHLDGLWLDVGQLSVGAREQLALLGRLACATLLGDQGGVLLFDDALGNTDPERLERLGAVLRAAGQHAQVIVLTSSPDRYRHVGGARRLVL